MTPRSLAARAVTATLGARPVEAVAAAATSGRLRVLAYHRVPDRGAFRAQVAHLHRRYRLVSGAQVAEALAGGPALPARAVWITFDDGDPTVVRDGLPVLAEAGAPATVFVCPGLVEADAPPWWREVEEAGEQGVGATVAGRRQVGRGLVRALKGVPDEERRAVLVGLAEEAPAGLRPQGAVALSETDLSRWLDAGLEVGNHTWDHPCLDRCSPDEQARQLRTAHDWLTRFLGSHPRLFAYPNGDHTAEAERVLAELGYEVGLLFDHALGSVAQPPLRISRLRLDTDAPVPRARAVLSGVHGALLGAVS